MKRETLDFEIDQWISDHVEEMKQELIAWVSHPSVSRADLKQEHAPYGPDVKAMLDFALERGRFYGFQTADHEGYCGDISYGEEGEELGFSCHLDVVPEGEGWIYSPYHPVEKDGFLIGRGVSDNKGSAIAVLSAFRFIQEKKIPLKRKLRLMLGCAEETGMADYKYYLQELKGEVPPLTIVADAAFPVCYAQKGGFNASLWIPAGRDIVSLNAGKVRNSIPDSAQLVVPEASISYEEAVLALEGYPAIEVSEIGSYLSITARGKAGHAAFPEGAVNAIWVLADAIVKSGLDQKADLRGLSFLAEAFSSPYGEGLRIGFADEQSGRLTLNAGVIQKEEDFLKTEIDIRFPVSYTVEQIEQALEESLKSFGVKLTDVDAARPYYIDPEDPVVQKLTGIYNEVAGDHARPYAMGGGTYSRVIPNAISYGPGLPLGKRPDFLPAGHGGAHGPDEALSIENWLTGLKIYIKTICLLAA
jgi:succinyl-diaminopimelate desuccinylase